MHERIRYEEWTERLGVEPGDRVWYFPGIARPENLVVDEDGYCKLLDVAMANGEVSIRIGDKTDFESP